MAVIRFADKATRARFKPEIGVGAGVFGAAMSKGLLFRAAGDTLLLCPPLIMSEKDINDIFDILEQSLDEMEVQFAQTPDRGLALRSNR